MHYAWVAMCQCKGALLSQEVTLKEPVPPQMSFPFHFLFTYIGSGPNYEYI